MTLVFLTLALVGLVFLVLSLLTGHHVDHDADAGGPGLLSLRGLAVFVTNFGAVGAVTSLALPARSGKTLIASVLGAVAGVAMGAVYLLAMRLVYSQQASSLVEDRELLDAEAHVTVAIPDGGIGEVSCRVAGQTVRRMARALGTRAIPEGTRVRIKDVYGDTVVVEPVA